MKNTILLRFPQDVPSFSLTTCCTRSRCPWAVTSLAPLLRLACRSHPPPHPGAGNGLVCSFPSLPRLWSSLTLFSLEKKMERKGTRQARGARSTAAARRFPFLRPAGLGPRGRGQGPEGVSYRLPPVSENKRDKGFILLLYWSIIHEICGGIPFLPLGSKGDVGGGRHGLDLNKPYYIPFSSRKRWNLLRKSDFSILSWLRIELMTSQLTRVLSKGVI